MLSLGPLVPTCASILRCAAQAGYHQDYVDSNGEYAHVPLALSLDLASQYRADGLQYRVGLHQVCRDCQPGAGLGVAGLRHCCQIAWLGGQG